MIDFVRQPWERVGSCRARQFPGALTSVPANRLPSLVDLPDGYSSCGELPNYPIDDERALAALAGIA